jgi:hypothetical protein
MQSVENMEKMLRPKLIVRKLATGRQQVQSHIKKSALFEGNGINAVRVTDYG